MRNLSLFQTSSVEFPESSSISSVAIDLDQNVFYVASERETTEGDVGVDIWKLSVEDVINDGINTAETEVTTMITAFTSPAYSTSNPWSSSIKPAELVSFRLLPDSSTLAFIMRGGEIVTASLDDDIPVVDVVGSFESGIHAAAWSPDESLLVLVTADSKLILMTSTFDPITETALHTTDFGEDAPINVGWGSKQTQFHGSLGKAAAQAPRPQSVGSSPDDDGLPRISWRGDGAYFAVSSLSSPPSPENHKPEARHRTFRVYDHNGKLQSTSEPTPGLEHVLSWRPSGNWIVGTQRYGFEGGGVGREGRHDLVMFERNGLRRGDFGIEKTINGPSKESVEAVALTKWGYRVREVSWSSDSNVLAIWISKNEGDIVQLWTTGNFHWYLKHEVAAPTLDGRPGRFTSVTWHPENALKLILTTASQVVQRTYAWETFSSPSKDPTDSGTVAVLDGVSILLTPFRAQNVPPPMSAFQLPVYPDAGVPHGRDPHLPANVALAQKRDVLAILWETGYVKVTDLRTRLGPGRGSIMDPLHIWSGSVKSGQDDRVHFRQVIHWTPEAIAEQDNNDGLQRFAVLGSGRTGTDFVVGVVLEKDGVKDRFEVKLPQRNGRLVSGGKIIAWQAPDGKIYVLETTNRSLSAVAQFPRFCEQSEHIRVSTGTSGGSDFSLFIGLGSDGKLYVSNTGASQLLASNVNSFTLASDFLVFTTTAHSSEYAPLSALREILIESTSKQSTGAVSLPKWETRRVERGSRIVTAVPSTMSLVLQMPRGNLETINPRPLVMKIVKQDIDNLDYSKAFTACRRHRVDLNVFVDYGKDTFMSNLSTFVDQVQEVDFINLFLTNVGQGSLPPGTIAQVCDGIRVELEKKDLKKYVNSILTAHVVKSPPDHEAGLALLLRLRDSEPQLVEDAVKYIIFLVDADQLFDTALGMYDFSLVLMIAQHAQKDPREYLPFLRELRALEKYYQRFKIDDHLKRYEKALKNLSLAGKDRFDEALQYIDRWQLYDAALSIWRGTDEYKVVLESYGDWLYERRDFKDAGFVFREAGNFNKAILAYEKSLDWQDLFDLAVQQTTSEEELSDIGYRVAEELTSKKRYQEAARVYLDYAKDVRSATIALVQGNQFSEARRLITLHRQPELFEDVVYPGAFESRSQIAEDINEMKDQLRKQLPRIRELRVKKVEEPDAFYGVEDTDLHNVDVMTDISMAPTMFTRYTVAPSAASRSSKRSSRSKRKLERKVGSGRKGTVDEEEYLLKSVTKLTVRFNVTQTDAVNLLPHLFQFTQEHRDEGEELQKEVADFGQELQKAVEEIWKKPEDKEEGTEGWAARMQEHENRRQIDPLEKVSKPELTKNEWNQKLSTIGMKTDT